MSTILNDLADQLKQNTAKIAELRDKEKDLKTAISAIQASHSPVDHQSLPENRKSLTVAEAIVEAIKNNSHKPSEILLFMQNHLGVSTTKATVNTTLSRIRKKGLVVNTNGGWFVPQQIKQDNASGAIKAPEASNNTDEAVTSSNESRDWRARIGLD